MLNFQTVYFNSSQLLLKKKNNKKKNLTLHQTVPAISICGKHMISFIHFSSLFHAVTEAAEVQTRFLMPVSSSGTGRKTFVKDLQVYEDVPRPSPQTRLQMYDLENLCFNNNFAQKWKLYNILHRLVHSTIPYHLFSSFHHKVSSPCKPPPTLHNCPSVLHRATLVLQSPVRCFFVVHLFNVPVKLPVICHLHSDLLPVSDLPSCHGLVCLFDCLIRLTSCCWLRAWFVSQIN